jgi:hypothetical protein
VSICIKDLVYILEISLQRAIEEERYVDAADIRDHAGAGLVNFGKHILFNFVFELIVKLARLKFA